MTDAPASRRDAFAQNLYEAHSDLAINVGQVALAWNSLHEAMCDLFAYVVTPAQKGVAWAIWHTVKSDAQQRDMLKAAIFAARGKDDETARLVAKCIDRLQAAASDRNRAIHAPYIINISRDGITAIPYEFTGNRYAKELKEKDVIKELYAYASNLHEFHKFFQEILLRFRAREETLPPLPAIPRVQHVAQATTGKKSQGTRKNKPKEH